VCHLPAVVIPAPHKPGQMPAGVQVIGPEGGDEELLAIAEALEAELGGFQPPPEEMLRRSGWVGVKGRTAKPKPPKLARAAAPKPVKPVRPKKPKPARPKKR
jgi:hypothetical protein